MKTALPLSCRAYITGFDVVFADLAAFASENISVI